MAKQLKKYLVLLGCLMGIIPLFPASAADQFFKNKAILDYPGNLKNPPVVDALNFVNSGTFIINSTFQFYQQPFYETSDTINYTNTGLMMGNFGFRYDNQSVQTGMRTMSGNFYNSGTISCGSTNNIEDPYQGRLFSWGFYNDWWYLVPQCVVNATNVICPGQITSGIYGNIQLAGQSVDLRHGIFNIEGFSQAQGGGASGLAYDFGANTNAWFPGFQLTATSAQSSWPVYLTLTNSQSYFDIATPSASNNVIRYVFIQDTSPSNVNYNVYFDSAGLGLGGGNVTVEWVGTYLDPATGLYQTNYLYLNNNYLESVATNIFISASGVPANFNFSQSSTPLVSSAPATAGFTNVFSFNAVTNRYSYVDAQIIPVTADTNSIVNQAITNLPGRMEVSASQDLSLDNVQITGVNYLSIDCTNQFNGSAGALIQAPYANIGIGVTNGFLRVSNTIAAFIPAFNGYVQAWSTRWVEADASGVTNDYRVLIIGSRFSPISPAQVQNMTLHGTNSVTINDALNVFGSFSTDAQNLTLNTNAVGEGATSFQGELNFTATDVYLGTSMPNLRNLTNNGAMRFGNLVEFKGVTNLTTSIPTTGITLASAQLFESWTNNKANVVANSTVQIGTNVYTFVKKLNKKFSNQVKIGKKFDDSMNNLIAAINNAAGAGSKYSRVMDTNSLAFAGSFNASNHSFVVSSVRSGPYGNGIRVATSSTNLAWMTFVSGFTNRTTLAGGSDPIVGETNSVSGEVPYANFVNWNYLADQGADIWTTNFYNSGTITNGVGGFNLDAVNSTLSGGSIVAGTQISIASENLLTSNVWLQAPSLILQVTNLLTDNGPLDTNRNFWTVGLTEGLGGAGFALITSNPQGVDLRGTTITNYAPVPNQVVRNTWSGLDMGPVPAGYTNNASLGRLILAPQSSDCRFEFSGVGASNALYVDYLELRDQATNFYNGQVPVLTFNTNLVIYYAHAVADGVSVSEKLNGLNSGHLQWVTNYAGYFTLTNAISSAGNNVSSVSGASTLARISSVVTPPPFQSSDVHLGIALPEAGASGVTLTWNSLPGSTSYVYWTTNLAASEWVPIFTNVAPTGAALMVTNQWTHVPNTILPGLYRVRVDPAN